MTQWVAIRSYHAVKAITRDGHVLTLCGRMVYGDIVDELPGEASCENCLRILARQKDRSVP